MRLKIIQYFFYIKHTYTIRKSLFLSKEKRFSWDFGAGYRKMKQYTYQYCLAPRNEMKLLYNETRLPFPYTFFPVTIII